MEEEGQDGEQSWYFVRATYKAVHLGRVRRRHLWERTVFLIRAPRSDGLVPDERAVLRANEVVAFEDTEAGIASAKTAGLRCLAVLGTLAPERLAAADEIVPAIDVPLMRRLLAPA